MRTLDVARRRIAEVQNQWKICVSKGVLDHTAHAQSQVHTYSNVKCTLFSGQSTFCCGILDEL